MWMWRLAFNHPVYDGVEHCGTPAAQPTASIVPHAYGFLGWPPSSEVAITPDGKHVHVPNIINSVSVIDTATNTVGNTVPLAAGTSPFGVAITPDGKHAYVTGFQANNVSVIATATNTVVATAPVGTNPFGVGIVPPPVVVPFVAFSAQLQIAFGSAFALESSFTLSSTAPGINPVTEPVTLRVGTFTITIPPWLLQAYRRLVHLRRVHQRRDPAGADHADGHLAIRVPGPRDGSELERNYEPGDRDTNHRQQQRHDLGQRPHCPLKTRASGVI
jgi:YVTN family beta-propeller protein